MMFSEETPPGDNPTFDGLVLRFRVRTKTDEARSRLEGREVTREAELVRVHRPGNKLSVLEYEVGDRERATPQYQAWKAGRVYGTPLNTWERTRDEDTIEELNAAGAYSVEDVANLSDSADVGEKFKLRQQARDFLAKRTAQAVTAAVDDRDSRIAALEAQLQALTAKEIK